MLLLHHHVSSGSHRRRCLSRRAHGPECIIRSRSEVTSAFIWRLSCCRPRHQRSSLSSNSSGFHAPLPRWLICCTISTIGALRPHLVTGFGHLVAWVVLMLNQIAASAILMHESFLRLHTLHARAVLTAKPFMILLSCCWTCSNARTALVLAHGASSAVIDW